MRKILLGFMIAYCLFNPKLTISIFSYIVNTGNKAVCSLSVDVKEK